MRLRPVADTGVSLFGELCPFLAVSMGVTMVEGESFGKCAGGGVLQGSCLEWIPQIKG